MLATILKINEFLNSKTMKIIDIAGSIGILAYATYLYINQEEYVFWAIVGILASIMAIVRPARFFSKKLDTKIK